MIHPNPTQLLLDRASAERAYVSQLDVLQVREAIRPLERRRLHSLAALVRASGQCRRSA